MPRAAALCMQAPLRAPRLIYVACVCPVALYTRRLARVALGLISEKMCSQVKSA